MAAAALKPQLASQCCSACRKAKASFLLCCNAVGAFWTFLKSNRLPSSSPCRSTASAPRAMSSPSGLISSPTPDWVESDRCTKSESKISGFLRRAQEVEVCLSSSPSSWGRHSDGHRGDALLRSACETTEVCKTAPQQRECSQWGYFLMTERLRVSRLSVLNVTPCGSGCQSVGQAPPNKLWRKTKVNKYDFFLSF